jgi:hypothetical protein
MGSVHKCAYIKQNIFGERNKCMKKTDDCNVACLEHTCQTEGCHKMAIKGYKYCLEDSRRLFCYQYRECGTRCTNRADKACHIHTCLMYGCDEHISAYKLCNKCIFTPVGAHLYQLHKDNKDINSTLTMYYTIIASCDVVSVAQLIELYHTNIPPAYKAVSD